MQRTIFFVSDRTGITAETLGHSLLTQFDKIKFRGINLPFIDNLDKAKQAVEQINYISRYSEDRPIIFSTLVNQEIRDIIANANASFFDFFGVFINSLEDELKVKSSYIVGRSHGLVDSNSYGIRIDAVNFALANDDGTSTKNYAKADIIIIGVSRSGKTPSCLYLALQFGVYAANYPLTDKDLEENKLPPLIKQYRDKIYGLSIDAERLHKVRHERRPDTEYSSFRQCQYEVRQAEAIFRIENIPYILTTTLSIEEIATTILAKTGIERRLF